jgi:monoamine oxidase|tara:strand:+ start:14 stop:226 length:213 start_codon:yes stop_codon:yes gene_type:complete
LKNKISRRSFLKRTGKAASLAAISPLSVSSILSRSSDDKRILVVGAGLAGLSCAYELDRAGFNVIFKTLN